MIDFCGKLRSRTDLSSKFFVSRTSLGRKLLSLRIRAIRAGMRLLSADEVLEEVRRRRGELDDEDNCSNR